MPGNPRAATVEDWDERTHEIVPDSQQVANTGAKVSSRLDHRFPEPLIDGASDSGYSSRTAATVNSTQSGPSGGKSPPPVLKQGAPKNDLTRKSSRRDRKDKERAARPDETMQMGAYPGPGYIQPRAPRSPSKPRRRDSYLRQQDVLYEGHNQYHPSTPVDSRPMEFSSHQPYYGRPPMPDYHVPPQPVGYPMEEYHTSRSGRPHSAYGPVYHSDRAVGWQVAPARGYAPPPQQQYHHYEHGPPVSSAWHQGSYSSSPHYGPQGNFPPEYYSQDYPYQRERSESREPSRRRNSMYGVPPPPPTEPEVFPDFEEDIEQYYARQPRDKPRGRGTIQPPVDYFDEDAVKMPPPPPPPPGSRSRNAPQIHQAKRPEARKSHTAAAAVPSQRRSSKALDMGDVRDALPELDYPTRRVSREVALPERSHSQSLRSSRRSQSYHDNPRGARMTVASSGRRRTESVYYDVDERAESPAMEDRVGAAERYQAVTAGRSTAQLPLSQETLMSKVGNGLGSDNGSQKSRSNSSRGSATKTEKEAQNMTLNMNGMTIAFGEESLAGKSISIRTGDQGAMQFNITDGTTRRPKAYVQGSSYSDNTHTGGSSRRVLENGRRARDRNDDRRSERSVHQSTGHRSSRSGYSRQYQI